MGVFLLSRFPNLRPQFYVSKIVFSQLPTRLMNTLYFHLCHIIKEVCFFQCKMKRETARGLLRMKREAIMRIASIYILYTYIHTELSLKKKTISFFFPVYLWPFQRYPVWRYPWKTKVTQYYISLSTYLYIHSVWFPI